MRKTPLHVTLILGVAATITLVLVIAPLIVGSVVNTGVAQWAIRAASQHMAYLPVVLRGSEIGPPPTPVRSLETLHLEASTLTTAQCIGCHGNKADEVSLDPTFPTAHRVHLTSTLLNVKCITCHQRVDLLQGSAASLRRQVDVELCATCHSPFPSVMQPAWRNLDCTTCHSNWRERMSEVTLVNLDAITAQDCLKCHGGAAWYQRR